LRKLFASLLFLALVFFGISGVADIASGEANTVGARWLVEGEGFAKKGLLRVKLNTNGTLNVKSVIEDGAESLTGYEVWGELNASQLGINTWSYHNLYELPAPVEVGRFDPTLNDPYALPTFTIDKLSYTVVLTSANSGTVHITGSIDIDVVGETEIDADCAIWRQGTPRPDIPEAGSGCDNGVGVIALVLVMMFALRARGSAKWFS
jgi:hypothetical protein